MNKFILTNYTPAIVLPTEEAACNIATFNVGTDIYAITRNVTYTIARSNNTTYWFGDNAHTTNYVYKFSGNSLVKIKKLNNPYFSGLHFHYNGAEDIRVINWDNRLFASYTKVNGNTHKSTMCFAELQDFALTNVMEKPMPTFVEKNWVPIEALPGHYVYSTKPYKIYNRNIDTFTNSTGFNYAYSGSTPLYRYRDGSISIIHQKHNNVYSHYFVLYDKNLIPYKISPPFSFTGATTEFICSMRINSDKIIVYPSVYDGITYMIEIDNVLLDKIMNGKLTNNTMQDDLYTKFANDALVIHAKEVATTLACGSINTKLLYNAITYNHTSSKLSLSMRIKRQTLLMNQFNKAKLMADNRG